MNIKDERKRNTINAKDLKIGNYFYFDERLCLITDEVIAYGSRDEYCYNFVDLSNGETDYIRNNEEVEIVDVDIIVKDFIKQ